MTSQTRRLTQVQPWNFTKAGSFGVFSAADSIPIEFFQTTFDNSELGKITFARDVAPNKLDFEMIMQREIDEDRARGKLKQYLNPDPVGGTTSSWHQVFFPPLLLACVYCRDNKIQKHYPDEIWEKEGSGNDERFVRLWSKMFKMEYFVNSAMGSSYTLKSPSGEYSQTIDQYEAKVEFKLSDDLEEGAKLIVVDGQHRLFALKELARTAEGEPTKNLILPVCILFSTSATKAANRHQKSRGLSELTNVPATFRKIFVDVNAKVEPVGAHTNILLNDANVGSLIVREFCDMVNREKENIGLSSIEWNIRSSKDSTILSRKHSLTSIGILDKALTECFGRRNTQESLFRRLLGIEDAGTDNKLRELADDPDNFKIGWENFSVAQRPLLVSKAQESIVSLLYEIFFGSTPYGKAFDQYKKELEKLRIQGKRNSAEHHEYVRAYEIVTKNFSMPKSDSVAFPHVRKLGQHLEMQRKKISPVMSHALFQRAVILSLKELMDAVPDLGVVHVGAGLRQLVSDAMNANLQLFDPKQKYTFRSIWSDTGTIIIHSGTRLQLNRLMLGMLASKKEARSVVSEMRLEGPKKEAAVSRLVTLGEKRIREFWGEFTRASETHFKKTYFFSYALGQDEVGELKEAELKQQEEIGEMEAGRLDVDSAQYPFDKLVRKHLSAVFESAETDLRTVIGLEKHIVRGESPIEDEEDE